MSDPEQSVDSKPSPDSEVTSDRYGSGEEAAQPGDSSVGPTATSAASLPSDPPSADAPSELSADAPSELSADAPSELSADAPSHATGDAPHSESGARKRSSIRPVRPDWKPSARPLSNPPRPMVVVYSGDRDRPDRWWDESEPASYPASLESDTPLPPEPTLSARELRPPPAARFPQIVPPAPDASIAPPPDFAATAPRALTSEDSDGKSTEAPVALSAAASSEPSLRAAVGGARPKRASAESAPELPKPVWFNSATRRRAAIVLVGAILGAYIAAHRPSPKAESSPEVSVKLTGAPEASVAAASEPAPMGEAPVAAPPIQPEIAPPLEAEAASPAKIEEPAPPPEPGVASPVVIEVVPWDAKVLIAGVAQPGPPFVINVPAGKRVAVEVARRGFAPRRVVVDGQEAKLTIGLLRNRAAPASPQVDTDPADPGKDSRLRVRSGL
ncbi:MAG: hypothetical protein ACOY0T_30205 [Myxococcota bacterium]